jgi:hypothetical protein
MNKMSDTTKFKDYTCNATIKARPMKLGEYNLHMGWEIPADEDPDDDGFLCLRKDDSETWVPKKLFLSTHVADTGLTLNLSFPVGTYEYSRRVAMLTGEPIHRKGWNRVGMYLVWQPGSTITPELARGGAAKAMAEEGFSEINIQGHMDMRTSDGVCVVGWTPTQSDQDGCDWVVGMPDSTVK